MGGGNEWVTTDSPIPPPRCPARHDFGCTKSAIYADASPDQWERRQGWLIYVRAGRGRSHKGRQVIYVRRLMDLLVCAETCEKMIFHDPEHRGAESTDDGWSLCGARCGHSSCSRSRRSTRSWAGETPTRTAPGAGCALHNGVLRSHRTVHTNNSLMLALLCWKEWLHNIICTPNKHLFIKLILYYVFNVQSKG